MALCAKELGISEKEFEDAKNLETLYGLIKNQTCAKCQSTPTHLDCSSLQWLCKTHVASRNNCKHICEDTFTAREVKELVQRYGKNKQRKSKASRKHHETSSLPPPVKPSTSDRKSRDRKSRVTRHSSSDSSRSSSDHRRTASTRPVSKHRAQSVCPDAKAVDFSYANMPGMASHLRQAPATSCPSTSFTGHLPFQNAPPYFGNVGFPQAYYSQASPNMGPPISQPSFPYQFPNQMTVNRQPVVPVRNNFARNFSEGASSNPFNTGGPNNNDPHFLMNTKSNQYQATGGIIPYTDDYYKQQKDWWD